VLIGLVNVENKYDDNISPLFSSQSVKIVETPLQHVDASGSGILQMRSVSHSPSAPKLNEHLLLSGNNGNGGSRSREDDFLDMDSDDDITIMVSIEDVDVLCILFHYVHLEGGVRCL